MAKYTTEVSTLFVSKLALINKFKKMDLSIKKNYIDSSLTRPYNPIEFIEEFGIEMFDYYFKNVDSAIPQSKINIWGVYSDEFKKQFWYEFWSKEIAQEDPLDWQRLIYGRMKKRIPILVLELEQLLTTDQAFLTEIGQAKQTQQVKSESQDANNSTSFSNDNSLNATATTPQDQLNFAVAVKSSYDLENESTITPDTDVKTVTHVDETQPIGAYNFDYADTVNGTNSNSNSTAAGFNHNTGTNDANTQNTNQGRSKDIFELIEKMDKFADGVFINYFNELKADSLFMGIN